jgi:hypothetical protein
MRITYVAAAMGMAIAIPFLAPVTALPIAVARADPTQDQQFLAYLTWHGVYPKDSSKRAAWEQEAIQAGHDICGTLSAAPPYEARRDVEHDLVRYHGMDQSLAHTMVGASVDAYCPQFSAD